MMSIQSTAKLFFLLGMIIFSSEAAMAGCRAGTTSTDPVHPTGFSDSDGWLYPVRKIRDIGFLSALANGSEDSTEQYLRSQNSNSCKHVYIANFTSHRDYISNKYSELIFAAGFFTEICKSFSINEQKLAELTYFFEILPIIDGYNGVSGAKAVRRSQQKISAAYWMKKRVKNSSGCQQLYRERFAYVHFVQ